MLALLLAIPPVPVVAVFNASEDTVDMLTMFFRQIGFRSVGEVCPAREPLKVEKAREFVAEHHPSVIVFDVSLPYDRNWEHFCDFRDADGVRHIPVLLTTTNKKALDAMVGLTEAIEVIGKPSDLDELAAAVNRLMQASHGGVNRAAAPLAT